MKPMIRHLTEPTRYRFTRAEYHRMGEEGILPPDCRVELLDGEIVEMSPIGPMHSFLVEAIRHVLESGLADSAIVRTQQPIILDDASELEPDIAVVEKTEDRYRYAHPLANQTLLLIEVADKTLKFDLGEKLRAYARASISEYWVIDVAGQSLIVHSDPRGEAYGSVTTHAADAVVAPKAFPSLQVDLAALPLA